MRRVLQLLPIGILLLPVPCAFAQREALNVDAQSSQVVFSLEGSAHSTHGTFHVQSGTVEFDSHAQKISGLVVVAAGSGQSGNGSRDKRMNTEILDVAHFTEVSFAPKSFQGTIAPNGDSTIQVTGVFTLRGTPHDLTVPMQVHIDGANCTARTHFMIPYVQWGLKDPSVFILKVAKEVGIDLTLVGHLAAAN
jgi:polyisoprenoid-binding protein YceI